MESSLIFVIVVVFGLFWLFERFLIDHKSSLIKSDVEKIKLKKLSNWAYVVGLFVTLGVVLLMNSKSTGFVPWLIAGSYILVWAVGGYFVWRAYRILIKNDITKANKQNGGVIHSPQKFSRSFAVSDLFTGLSIWIFAIAILVFKFKLEIWGAFFVLIVVLRHFASRRFEKADEEKT